MDIPFALLHISTFLAFILLILILRIRNKKALHYFFIFADIDLFVWCTLLLIHQYIQTNDTQTETIFYSCFNTLLICLSTLLFFIGYCYSKSGSKFNPRVYLLFITPCLSIILIWTNPLHHLFYSYYSREVKSFIHGPIFDFISYIDYIYIILGLFFLVRFSIKNAGFFSKQSALIFLGILIPVVVDIGIFTKLLSVPKYFDAIAFTATVVCFLVAIFRYDLFTIVPVALQTVVDHISDSFLVMNDKLEVIDFNKTFVESFKSIATVRRKEPFRGLFRANLSEKTVTNIEKIEISVKEQKLSGFDIQVTEKNFDKYFIVEITPVISNGSNVCTIVLFKDITVQKRDAELIARTQVALLESEHLASLGQLVGGIAHNLKTPIMSIAGGLEGLIDLIDEYEESVEDDSITVEDHHEIAGDMRLWIGKMKEYTAYMSDVITTVKGQAVQLTASTTDSFTLRELIKRVEILMNHELKRYCCKLNVNCSIDMDVLVRGEINSFVQVINNLVINAIDAYEGKEGVIEFNISRDELDEQMIRFEVKDLGSGMTDEVKDKLFKEMITTKAKNGTGLGLYMSYSTITGRFGGKMWFESVHGMGTSFYIVIPAV